MSFVGTYATRVNVKTRLGITDATDDALLDTLCDQLNAWIETTCGRVIAPRTETQIVLDGTLAEDGGRILPVLFGLNSLTTLEVATQTGADWQTVAATDYFLRPLAIMRRPGWPATHIVMSDVPKGSVSRFYAGFGNVRLSGSAGFAGWPAIPNDLVDVANTVVVRAWAARQSGQADIIGNDETGAPLVSRFLSLRDRATLRRYDAHPRVVGSDRTVVSWG